MSLLTNDLNAAMVSEDVCLELDASVWLDIVSRISGPDLKEQKRSGLVHEMNIPCVLKYVNVTSKNTTSYVNFVDQGDIVNTSQRFYEMCNNCWSCDLRIDDVRGLTICKRCGTILDEHSRHTSYQESYGRPMASFMQEDLPRRHSSNIYKRCHHFRNWLMRIQGKERYSIPDHESRMIIETMKKYGFTATTVDYESMRFILKRLQMQHHYNHTFWIIQYITGSRIIELDRCHEDKLYRMFLSVQKAFSDNCGIRVNMLNYGYLIKKMSELNGWIDLANAVPCIKSPVKLIQQDSIWKTVCHEVGLTFIKSI